jgi:hypothetical protein
LSRLYGLALQVSRIDLQINPAFGIIESFTVYANEKLGERASNRLTFCFLAVSIIDEITSLQ